MYQKAFFLLLVGIFCSSLLFAQNPLKKGVYNLGGGLLISYVSSDNDYGATSDQTDLRISPSIGYFVTDNLLIGGSVGFSYSEYNSDSQMGNDFKHVSRQVNIGPSIRYYLPADKLVPFIGAGAAFSKMLGSDFETTMFNGEVGINYFISSSAAIEPYLNYSIHNYSGQDKAVNLLAFGIRFSYYIID